MGDDTKVYAAGLLEATEEYEQTWRELRAVSDVLARVSAAKQLLVDAMLSDEITRTKLVKRLLPNLSALVQRLVAVLTQAGQLDLLPKIANQYETLYRENYGVVEVLIESPVKLSETERELLVARFTKPTQRPIVTEKRSPRLLGGIRVTVGDMTYDLSLDGTLNRLQERLMYG